MEEPKTASIRGVRWLARLPRDLMSVAVVALVMVSYSLSFALLIFSGPLAPYLSFGVSMTMLTAGLWGAVVALTSSYKLSISGPDTATMAVVSAMAAGVAGHFSEPSEAMLIHVLVAIITTTLMAGVVLFALGSLRMGVWMRYIPYPVLGGFLASAGWLLTAGSIKVMTGTQLTVDNLPLLLESHALGPLVAGIAFAATIFVGRSQFKHDFVLPGILLGGMALVHTVIPLSGISLSEARDLGWLFPDYEVLPPWLPWNSEVLDVLQWSKLIPQAGEVGAAVGVTAVAILLNATGLEVWRKSELELDREFQAHGFANLLTGLLGGTIGNLSLNRTMLNQGAGAQSRLAGFFMGVFCLLVLFAGSALIGHIPTPILGGLLLYLGLTVLWNWLVRSWRRMSRPDFVLIVAILLLIVHRGYLEGLALGVVASCIFFALNYSRVRVIKHNLTRQEYGSYVERSVEQARLLHRNGNEIQILWLQGYLFFGSANRLMEEIKRRVEADMDPPVHFIVLDFRLVGGIDSSAVFSFIKLRNFAEERDVQLIFCGVSEATLTAFRIEGLLVPDDPVAVLQPNLDLALERAEDGVLAEWHAEAVSAPAFERWLTRELDSEVVTSRFMEYLELVDLAAGDYLFQQGDPAEALYFVVSGRVSVVLERPGVAPIRLRSMIGYTVIGEMGLYRDVSRAASVIAEQESQVFRLSRDSLQRMQETDPRIGNAFHAFIVRVLADRLSFANEEIAALQR